MASFNPNALSFDQGVERIKKAATAAGLRADAIVTSRDDAARKAVRALAVDNVPNGFTKWQLPVYLDCASQLFMSFAAPNTKVPEHSHDEGDGIRFILSGSIRYQDQELVAGDWMFIPKGKPYRFEVGPMGVGMCYCYCCCCA
jgi:hypothetical protein